MGAKITSRSLSTNRDTHFYTLITRTVELKEVPRAGVHSIDKVKGVSKAEIIFEYCREPRTGREIIEFLGMEYRQYSRTKYIKPLLDSGKLKLMLPKHKANRTQRFVNAEVEIAIPTDEAIIEYCKIPRRKKEIREYFGLKLFQVKSHIDPLIADGRLKGTEPDNPQNHWQRFVSAEFGKPVSLTELILDFCKEPRTRREIAERTGINIVHMKEHTQPLVDSGKLKMKIPESPTSKFQKFVVAEF